MTAPTPQEVTDVGLRLKHSADSPALAIGLRDLLADAADTLTAVTAERDQVRAEVKRLHSWDGLMELLDEHWPEEFLPTLPDDNKRDPGPRIVSLMRWVDQARQMLADAEKKIASMELDESLREEDERFADPL